jgi:hypothetical protein
MEAKHAVEPTSQRPAATMGTLLLLFGTLLLLMLQPPGVFESGSAMGNYKIPGSSHGGQGTTPPTTTGPSPYTTPPAGSNVIPTLVLDVLAPINETANSL